MAIKQQRRKYIREILKCYSVMYCKKVKYFSKTVKYFEKDVLKYPSHFK